MKILGGGGELWGDIPGLLPCMNLLNVELSLPVYQVRLDWLPLPCIALIRPNRGSSVGRASVS